MLKFWHDVYRPALGRYSCVFCLSATAGCRHLGWVLEGMIKNAEGFYADIFSWWLKIFTHIIYNNEFYAPCCRLLTVSGLQSVGAGDAEYLSRGKERFNEWCNYTNDVPVLWDLNRKLQVYFFTKDIFRCCLGMTSILRALLFIMQWMRCV